MFGVLGPWDKFSTTRKAQETPWVVSLNKGTPIYKSDYYGDLPKLVSLILGTPHILHGTQPQMPLNTKGEKEPAAPLATRSFIQQPTLMDWHLDNG